MIIASAPGKVVMWGEYAVLAGAPAVVMAVDRRARCRIDPDPEAGTNPPGVWRFRALGLPAPPASLSLADLEQEPAAESPARLAWHLLRQVGSEGLPERADVELDTRAFYDAGAKLGIGSSAALVVALGGAIERLRGRSVTLEDVMTAHYRAQGNRGSGMDVAAAWHGGLVRFEQRHAAPFAWPRGLGFRFFSTGRPAATVTHLSRFASYRQRPRTPALQRLFERTLACTEDPGLPALKLYARALADLDQEGALGIFDGGHSELAGLAPWGDLGVLFYEHAEAAERFTQLAAARGAQHIDLDTAIHGIQTSG
jgi:phosphomevalonate kinase